MVSVRMIKGMGEIQVQFNNVTVSMVSKLSVYDTQEYISRKQSSPQPEGDATTTPEDPEEISTPDKHRPIPSVPQSTFLFSHLRFVPDQSSSETELSNDRRNNCLLLVAAVQVSLFFLHSLSKRKKYDGGIH